MQEHDPSRNSFDAIDPAQKLLQYEEFSKERANPFVAAFARHIVPLIEDHSTVDPLDFVLASEMAIDSLKTGIDCFTQQPVSGSLVKRSERMYAFLRSSVPEIAEAAFSKDFALAVKEEQVKMRQLIETDEKTGLTPQPEDKDTIHVEIENTDQAMEFIILGAKQRILGMDWESVGLEDREDLKDSCDSLIFQILLKTGLDFPLDVIDIEAQESRYLLYNLPADHKTNIYKNYWFVIKDYSISPQAATSIRDWIWINAVSMIAESQHISADKTLDHFKDTNKAFEYALQTILLRMAEEPIP